MIRARAAGKLFIAGEYAVVEPGQPSVLIAVDRFVTVDLEPAADRGRIHSDQYGRQPLVWRREGDRIVLEHEDRPADYVPVAIMLVERLAVERGRELSFYDLTIGSELDDVNGRKFGLGSSAAVTVAVIRALGEFYRLQLSADEVFRLAMLATVEVNRQASGGDIAASVHGGWIAYSAPDREALMARRAEPLSVLLAEEWPGLAVRQLPPPAGLRLLVGWTGEPASTASYVSELSKRAWRRSAAYGEFLDASRAIVGRLIAALDAGDDEAVLGAISAARGLLADLSSQAALTIETPALGALCEAAQRIGGAGKSSGAGGGDCGIALVPADADIAPLVRDWEQHDVRHLTLTVLPDEETRA